MKDNIYKSILSMLVGWSLLSFITQIDWIAYIAVAIAFLAIAYEKFAIRLVDVLHSVFILIFTFIQKALLTIIFYLIVSPISLLKRDKEQKKEIWHSPEKTNIQQLKKLW